MHLEPKVEPVVEVLETHRAIVLLIVRPTEDEGVLEHALILALQVTILNVSHKLIHERVEHFLRKTRAEAQRAAGARPYAHGPISGVSEL